MSGPVDRVLGALRAAGLTPRRAGGGWTCPCPAHDDRNPSLSINTGDDGRALLKCHAGCAIDDVCAAIGLRPADLFADDPTAASHNGHIARARPASTFSTAGEAVTYLEKRHGRRSATWTYQDAEGEPVGMVVRWDIPAGKVVRPASRRPRGWTLGGMTAPRPLYQLPDLLAAPARDRGRRVYVVEGEKAADAARALGLLATTSPHGSKSATKADWSPLAGREVVILPDHDEAGERYAADVARLLTAGAASVRVLRLADHFKLAAGGDIADLAESVTTDAERAQLGRSIDAMADAVEVDGEPEPDAPAPVTDNAMKPFPVEALPYVLQDFIRKAAATLGVDPATLAAPLLSVVASAIGNARWIEVKSLFVQPPNLWTAVVLPSGSLKTPALQTVRRWPDARDDEAYRDYRRRMVEYEESRTDWQKGDPPPVKPRRTQFVVQETTIEAMVGTLERNPRGVVAIVDEMRQWFASQGKYGGGDSRMADMAAWNQIYDGSKITQDRASGDSRRVKHASASICGMIQPEMFRDALTDDSFASGQAARFLACQPPSAAWTWTTEVVSEDDFAPLDAMFDRLYGLAPAEDPHGDIAPVLVGLEAEAITLFREFAEPLAQKAIEPMTPASHAAALSKMRGVCARLALIFQLARWASGEPAAPDLVDAASMEMAVAVAAWWADETLRVYDQFASSRQDQDLVRLVKWIESKGGEVTPSDLVRGIRAFRKEGVAGAEAKLDAIAKAGLGVWAYSSGGRKRVLRVPGANKSTVNGFGPPGIKNTGSIDVDTVDGLRNGRPS